MDCNPNDLVCQGESAYLSKINDNKVKLRQPCQNTKCPHHIFYEKIFSDDGLNGQINHLIPHENDLSRSWFNCCCEIDRPLTLEEIGNLYTVSGRATIQRILKQSIKNIKRKNLNNLREYYE
jgi:hypothetical protein